MSSDADNVNSVIREVAYDGGQRRRTHDELCSHRRGYLRAVATLGGVEIAATSVPSSRFVMEAALATTFNPTLDVCKYGA